MEQTANTAVYTGPVSGVVNAGTRDVIRMWLANDFRCPVIVEAWTMRANARFQLHQINGDFGVNLWLHGD